MSPAPLPRRTWSDDVYGPLTALLDRRAGEGLCVFDWDDTVLEGDVSLAFMRWHDAEHGTDWHDSYFRLLEEGGRDLAYPQITRWLAGHTPDSLSTLARRALAEVLSRGEVAFRPEMVDLIRAMQARDWQVWVVTASPAAVVSVMAETVDLPTDRILGMRLATGPDGRFTDEVVPPATFCEGKAVAVRTLVGRTPDLVAGDSRSDADMMALARHGLLVDGHDVSLREEARQRGWWIQSGWRHTPAEPGVPTG